MIFADRPLPALRGFRHERPPIRRRIFLLFIRRTGMPDVVIAGAVRTPIGRFGGGLATLSAADLGTVAARAALERAGVPADAVEETILGCARQAGAGPNVARQVAYRAGVPAERPAFTVNMACASGL